MVEAKGGGERERERGGDETREVQVCRGCSLFKLNKAVIFCVSAVCEGRLCARDGACARDCPSKILLATPTSNIFL